MIDEKPVAVLNHADGSVKYFTMIFTAWRHVHKKIDLLANYPEICREVNSTGFYGCKHYAIIEFDKNGKLKGEEKGE